MTASKMVAQQLFDAMEMHERYYFRRLRALPALRGIEDQRLRNALVSLQSNGRVMRTGTHARYRYYINPIQPVLRAGAAKAKAKATPRGAAKYRAKPTPDHDEPPQMLALAANWPAVRDTARFDAAPIWRISA